MRSFLLLALILIVSCKNQTNNKTTSKNKHDSIKESKSVIVASSTKSISDDDFSVFWKKFRTSVLNFDTTQIIALTKFPFQTKGDLDDDPVIEYNKRNFISVFRTFLNQWNGDLNGGSELDIIKKKKELNKSDIQNDIARIGELVFSKTDNHWKLVMIYLTYDTIDSLTKQGIKGNKMS